MQRIQYIQYTQNEQHQQRMTYSIILYDKVTIKKQFAEIQRYFININKLS